MGEDDAGNPRPERRVPILSDWEAYPKEELAREWRLVTEAVRRDIVANPNLSRALVTFIDTPVAEELPGRFVEEAGACDPRIKRLARRYSSIAGKFMALPAVPPDEIRPDIRHAPRLVTPEAYRLHLERTYGDDAAMIEELSADFEQSYTFNIGMTFPETEMVAQRYAFARDVKIMALGAELALNTQITVNQNDEVITPGGVQIITGEVDPGEIGALLQPSQWVARRQLKDRVYEVETARGKYILKEQKTRFHTDTKKGGHIEGARSKDEFETAKHFNENGTVKRNGIQLSWERPMGVVTFPDGYQFALFEHEGEMVSDREIVSKLGKSIMGRKSQFAEEFERIARVVNENKENPQYLSGSSLLSKSQERPRPDLTFEDFARVKAQRMKRIAKGMLKSAVRQEGYSNSDTDGFAYRVGESDGIIQLEIVGMDFEYFSIIGHQDAQKKLGREERFDNDWEVRHGLGIGSWPDGNQVSPVQEVCYMALLEAEGWDLSKRMRK